MKKLLYNQFHNSWILLSSLMILVDFLVKRKFSFSVGYIIEIAILFLFLTGNKKHRIAIYDKNVNMLFYSGIFCLIIMFVSHVFAGLIYTYGIIFPFIDYFFFLYYAQYSKINCLEDIGFSIKLLTLLGCLHVLVIYMGGNFANWRELALIDKSYLTLFFAVSQALCITDIIFKKHIYMNIFFLIFFTWINSFFVFSKTSFVSLVFLLILLVVLSKGRIRWYMILMLLVGLIIIINFETLLPRAFANLINVVTNSDVYYFSESDARQRSLTYDVRGDIIGYALSLFYNSPLWGIGIGGYHESGGFLGVLECESSYLDMLVGGGILYFLPVFANMIVPFFLICINIKFKGVNTYQSYWVVSVLASLLICFLWNDFIFPSTFALIGICSYITFDKFKRLSFR